jgi:hypothetical protein
MPFTTAGSEHSRALGAILIALAVIPLYGIVPCYLPFMLRDWAAERTPLILRHAFFGEWGKRAAVLTVVARRLGPAAAHIVNRNACIYFLRSCL